MFARCHVSKCSSVRNQWRRQDFVTGGSEVWVYRGSRVRSPPVPVVLSVYQRGSLLDGLAMYLSCDTKKFNDNESTHILHNFWTSTHRGGSFPPSPLAAPLFGTVRRRRKPAVFKLGSADQRGSTTGSHGVRERIPKSSNCLHGF